MTKRILALVLAVAIAAMSLPIFAFAATGVTYYDYDPSTKTLVEKTLPAGTTVTTITAGDTEDDIMPGWNLIVGNVTIPNYFFLLGEVSFILADGATLTTEGIGVELLENNGSFTVYAQSTGDNMGRIVTTGCENAAGIGGGYSEAVGDIVIFGGIIDVTGGDGGAGIGSGFGGSCSNISIFGGIINATGGTGAAGIGSGAGGVGNESSCENIALQGGIVNAVGGSDAAGIGCGDGGSCGYATVVGAYVKAVAGGETANPIDNLMTSRIATLVEEENAQYVNYEPVAAADATCTKMGHDAYVIDHANALYYTAFPFTADGLIGDGAALAAWDGNTPALGHDYVVGEDNHTCTRCDLDESHVDDNADYICDLCKGELLDDAKSDMRWLLYVLAQDKSNDVDHIASDYRYQIFVATTVADVLRLYEEGVAAIKQQIAAEEAAKLAAAKDDAIAALNDAAGENVSAAMTAVLNDAKAVVNAAKTIEAVNVAKEAGLAAIALQFAKDTVLADLAAAAGTDLTAGMEAVLNDAVAAVNAAETIEDVATAREIGLAAIALQNLKEQAISELTAAAGPTPLSQPMTAVLNDAKAAVNAAETKEEVENAKQNGLRLIALQKARDEGAAKALDDAKTASKAALSVAAGDERTEAMTAVLNAAKATVDAANTVAAVISAEQIGLLQIMAQAQAETQAKELNKAKEDALKPFTAILEDDSASEALKAIAEEAVEAITNDTDVQSVKETAASYEDKCEARETAEGLLAECEIILASDEYSDEVKTLVNEFTEALDEAQTLDDVQFALLEYGPAIRLQDDRDKWMAKLEELLPEEPSDAVKAILDDAKELILFGEDSSIFDNVYNIARDALSRQLTAEANVAALENLLKQTAEDLEAANDTIDELNDTVKGNEATIAEKQAALDAATEQLNAAKADLETAKANIAALETATAEQEKALAQAEQQMKDLQAEIERLKALLDNPTEPQPTNPTEPTETGADETVLGDANGDGAVNMKDVLLMRKYLADMDVEYNARNADVNGDGVVNMKDVLTMRKFLAEVIDILGA